MNAAVEKHPSDEQLNEALRRAEAREAKRRTLDRAQRRRQHRADGDVRPSIWDRLTPPRGIRTKV